MHGRIYATIMIAFLWLSGLMGSHAAPVSAKPAVRTVIRNALQQDTAVVYLRYDTEIVVQEDGVMRVREEQEILFNEAFRTAFAEIPLDYVTEIRNVIVSADGVVYDEVSGIPREPGSYQVSRESDNVFVEWMYEETTPGETRIFVLEYEVVGGLWVYEDGDVLEWRAVPADRGGVPVASSSVTVSLPAGVGGSIQETTAFGPDFTVEVAGDQVTFTARGGVADGTAFHIMVGFAHGLVDATVQPWQRAEDSAALAYSIPEVEVALEITGDGVVHVTERQRVAVDAGVLYGGSRIIPLAFVDDLTGFTVLEGEAAYQMMNEANEQCESCAWMTRRAGDGSWVRVHGATRQMVINEQAAGDVRVTWTAPPLVRGEETTFVINYTAVGALQVTDEAQTLSWTPVSGFDVTVATARMLVDLPPGVAPESVTVEGVGSVATASDGRLVVTRDEPLPPGEAWPVRVQMPAGATTSSVPAWQQEMEAVVAQVAAIQEEIRLQEMQRARQQLAFGVAGVMLLVGGLLLVGLLWYMWGRDSEGGVAPHYLSEPPSSLPPGIVAYLLDEKPTPKGVLASLFHLATLGLIRIDLTKDVQIARNWEGELEEGQEVENADGQMVTIPTHMMLLFNGLREHLGAQLAPLSQIASRLPQIIPQVYYAMGEEATAFFAQLPDRARRRWLVYGQWLVLGGVGLAIAAAILYAGRLGWVATLPAIALAIVGAALIVVSRWMPQRSAAGAWEVARWRAFETYLRNLQKYGDEESAQAILDRHFAYAVALDVEEVVLAQAEKMGGRMPSWTRPVVLQGPRTGSDTTAYPSGRGPLRRKPVPDIPGEVQRLPEWGGSSRETGSGGLPSLTGMADALSTYLNQANSNLTRTLQQAVGEAGETPFDLVWRGAQGAGKLTWKATTTSLEIIDAILDDASSGGGGSSFRGSSGGSMRRSSGSSWGSSRSSRSSSRSSSSRRSGGGGRRGFGR